jgi:formylglycine-generating enzyme required for sulfatase activity
MHAKRHGGCLSATLLSIVSVVLLAVAPPPEDLSRHLHAIATLARSSPVIPIAEGWFLMGTIRKDDEPYALETQFDDTEFPQRRVWLNAYQIDRDEVSLAEYLDFLQAQRRETPAELRRLITHLITVHSLPDYVMASWPALYVTWQEAADFCQARGKRLPTEAEWEKAARGTEGNLFPWGAAPPAPGRAVFGQHHVHEIPLVAAVNSGEEGQSPYGLRHMAGNIAEWVQDWFGFDYYPIMPERNPPGPNTGRYKVVRGGSWRSDPALLRAATRNGAIPEQRSPTIGFRCAKSG